MANGKRLWLALAMVGSAALGAKPDGAPQNPALLSTAYHDCTGRTPSTAEMSQCIEAELDRQEKRLNQTYRSTIARLAPPRREALRVSERAWIRDRQRSCEQVYRDMHGGTGDGIARDTCLAIRAIRRAEWLERFR